MNTEELTSSLSAFDSDFNLRRQQQTQPMQRSRGLRVVSCNPFGNYSVDESRMADHSTMTHATKDVDQKGRATLVSEPGIVNRRLNYKPTKKRP